MGHRPQYGIFSVRVSVLDHGLAFLADHNLLPNFALCLFKARFEVVVPRGVRDSSEGLSLSLF